MSRRGNCWDNAPQESFFGHFKDEAYIKPCNTLEELKDEIKKYMTYYNNYRYQWNLKKMTPVEYRNHLLDVAYLFLKCPLQRVQIKIWIAFLFIHIVNIQSDQVSQLY